GVGVALWRGGAGALVVGLFLVYTALSVSGAERRHDIGVLRAVGATRGQVQLLFAGEAGLLGLAGSVLGLPVGLALAYGALGPLQTVLSDIFLPLALRRLETTPLTIAGCLVAGVGPALLGALVPPPQAAAEEPAEAVRRVPQIPSILSRIFQAAVTALLVLAGVSLVGLREWLPPRVGAFGGVVALLVSTLVAAPLLTALAAYVL